MSRQVFISVEIPDQPDVMRLLDADDASSASLYPPGNNYMLALDALLGPSVTFPIARAEDFAALKLETGIYQPAALALYRSAGFAEVPPFGEYEADPVSVFMAKTIA